MNKTWCPFFHNRTTYIYHLLSCISMSYLPIHPLSKKAARSDKNKNICFGSNCALSKQNKTSAQALSLKDGTILLIDVFSAFRCSYSILQIWKRWKKWGLLFCHKMELSIQFYVHKPNRICISQIWKYILFPSWVYFQESPYKNWPVLCTQKPHYDFFFA